MTLLTQWTSCWTLGTQQQTHNPEAKIDFNQIIATVVIIKCVCDSIVISSGPKEEQGYLTHVPEDVTFQLKTEELMERTWILFVHTRTMRDIECWVGEEFKVQVV